MKNIAMLTVFVVCAATLPAQDGYTITASRDYVDLKVAEVQTNTIAVAAVLQTDIAAASVAATNYTDAVVAGVPGTVSNVVTKAYVESLGIASEETDPVFADFLARGGTVTGQITQHNEDMPPKRLSEMGFKVTYNHYGSSPDTIYSLGAILEGDNVFHLPSASGTLATTNDIPVSMAWSVITNKPTTISGYGITDALKADFTSLTNSTAFTLAVEEVSPPADTSDCIRYLDEGDEIPLEGVYLAYSHNYAYVTNVTGYVTNVVDSVTNIVEVYSVTTNSYPAVALYSNGTKIWTSDPADESNIGWLIGLILALVGGAGTVLWRYFGKSKYTLKIDPDTGSIYYETEG